MSKRLPDAEVFSLLRGAGIPLPAVFWARSPSEAAEAADGMGFPVVLKIVSADVEHKSDVGGVVLDVRSREEAERAYRKIVTSVREAAPEARLDGVMVMKQMDTDREVITGVVQDATFGPVIMFGLGGVATELFKEVAFRALPLSEQDAKDIMAETRASKMLGAFRGKPPVDFAAVESLLLSVSRLTEAHPEIDQVDLNPVVVGPKGAVVVDARIVVKE